MQVGGRRPSCFSNFTISGHSFVECVELMLCIKFGYDLTYGSTVSDIFLPHMKCITGTPKLMFWGFMGENLKFYFSKLLFT